MKFVTFKDLVPGMVLYPVDDVKGFSLDDINYLDSIILFKTILENTDPFWGDTRTMKFIEVRDAYNGACFSNWRTDDEFVWLVVDDQPVLDKIRAEIKREINKHRDHLDETERFIDANL